VQTGGGGGGHVAPFSQVAPPVLQLVLSCRSQTISPPQSALLAQNFGAHVLMGLAGESSGAVLVQSASGAQDLFGGVVGTGATPQAKPAAQS
jgi:hypothetical protein